MDKNLEANLKNLMADLLASMDFEAEIQIDASQDDILMVNLNCQEAGLLIGQGGENLSALQHLARIIASKRLGGEQINFIVDVNNYRGNRVALLKEMALHAAQQVLNDGQTKTLEPMPSYERRIIHLALKDQSGIITESQGEGQLRRVVIKPGSNA